MGSDGGTLLDGAGLDGAGRVVVVVVVCSLAASAIALAGGGPVAGQQDGPNESDGSDGTATEGGDDGPSVPVGDSGSYAVEQGDECYRVSALSGDQPVREFYGYAIPRENSPYRGADGNSYSSEGTTDLQRPDTSILFLYEGPDGNLSLVFVHGNYGAEADGGSLSAEITGLPAEGRWAVKDDQYDGPSNFDRWSTDDSSADVDWTYGSNRTDGGAYEGLGESFEVTVDPAFNRQAALYREYYDGTIDRWSFVTDSREDPSYRSLDMSEPVTVSRGLCSGLPVGETPGGDGPPTDSGGDDDGSDEDDGDDGIDITVSGEDGVSVGADSDDGVGVTAG